MLTKHLTRSILEDEPLQDSLSTDQYLLYLYLWKEKCVCCSPAALARGIDESATSRWMDLGLGFFLRLPHRGLMTSSMSSISLSCFFLRYSFLMYSLLAFSSSFFCSSSSAFNLEESKKFSFGPNQDSFKPGRMEGRPTVQLPSSAPGPALVVASSPEPPSASSSSSPAGQLSLLPYLLPLSHHPGNNITLKW